LKQQQKKLTPVGTIVFQDIVTIDRDMPNKPNSQISFSIEKGPYSDFFELPLTTKSEIAIAKLIQYDLFKSCNLTIKAEVGAAFFPPLPIFIEP
jgi:hypothetical protein